MYVEWLEWTCLELDIVDLHCKYSSFNWAPLSLTTSFFLSSLSIYIFFKPRTRDEVVHAGLSKHTDCFFLHFLLHYPFRDFEHIILHQYHWKSTNLRETRAKIFFKNHWFSSGTCFAISGGSSQRKEGWISSSTYELDEIQLFAVRILIFIFVSKDTTWAERLL